MRIYDDTATSIQELMHKPNALYLFLTLYILPRSTPSLVGSIEVPLNMLMGGGNDDGAMPVIPERKIPIGDVNGDDDDDNNNEDDARNNSGGGETTNNSDRRVAGTNADTVTIAGNN